MAMERLQVNCLVQVISDNGLDFSEWLDYHIALGFDTIFVFDAGDKPWLPGVCSRRKTHVELVPSSDAPDGQWTYKSDIIAEYVARRTSPEWCVCLEDNEFLWIGPKAFRGIRDYVGSMPMDATACTFYYKVLSSKEPTRYRVGTQIDCFTHARREPEGFVPAYSFLPNGGVTIFRVLGTEMPLTDPVVPRNLGGWYDASFRRLTYTRYNEEITSRKFAPMQYPARCYKFGIRSGVEMGFKDDAVPQGFDVLDLTLQTARERLIHIPVNPETETLFAKFEPEEQTATVETAGGQKVEVSPERAAELALPITRARIDKMIMKGQFFEDICDYVASKDPNYDRATLERMFDTERENIIKTSLPYADLQEMLDTGATDAEIMRKLVLTQSTLDRMKKALPVLDIDTGKAPAVVAPNSDGESIAVEVAAFNESVSKGAMTPEVAIQVDAELAKRAKRPAKKTKKKKPAAKKQTGTGKTKEPVRDDAGNESSDRPAETEQLDDLIASVNIDGIMANVEAHNEKV